MFKNKKLLFAIPLMLIGVFMILLGSRWLLSNEPWMLDQVANEERLEMSFEELFSVESNKTLPGYLEQIYKFFGLWVIIIGLFIVMFSRPKMIENKNIRFSLIICVGLMTYAGLILGHWLIPSSPFIYLGWLLIGMHSIALFSMQIERN